MQPGKFPKLPCELKLGDRDCGWLNSWKRMSVNTNKSLTVGQLWQDHEVAARKSRAKSVAGSLTLIAAGVMVALAIAEASARHFFPPLRDVSWYHYDPRYTMRYRENIDVIARGDWGDGAPWHFRTNSRGFTGGECNSVPAAGNSRLIIAGGFVHGCQRVDDGGAYLNVAEQTLRASGLRLEVLNLGVSAWGPQNALGYLSTEGADIRGSCRLWIFSRQ